eukprot:TRINITY_DN6995_c0_g2_i1.p1 TRINITY_DN6995_c0_g2~~TRINITY_DN6995_c0_g2_i1.p1  ORF type:complete len:565 (+),score=85.89 TRINITY_DN6995_c0_g2_i1:217-1911(+)
MHSAGAAAHAGHSHRTGREWLRDALSRRFLWLLFIIETAIIILYALFVRYPHIEAAPLPPNATPAALAAADAAAHHEAHDEFFSHYPLFQDVHVMVYVGFGFLMTFLARYAWGAVGFTFLLSAVAVQWAVLTRNFFERAIVDGAWHHYIELSLENLITAEFAAGSFLIAFGAVIGRVSPTQLLVMVLIHIIGYGANEHVGFWMKAADPGGAMVLHAYGAYFGLACSFVLFNRCGRRESRGPSAPRADPPGEAGSSRMHAVTSMIGTLFLYLFWPSFNSAIAVNPARVITNTYLSLTASCIATFFTSHLCREGGALKFDMEDVQNATIAGGVVMGAASDFLIEPWAALLIGLLTGVISTLGFNFLTPFLHRTIGLNDTCGVHNLHAIPGVLGGVASIIAAAVCAQSSGLAPDDRSNLYQARMQAACLGVSVALGIGFGAFAGFILRIPCLWEEPQTTLYDDNEFWIVHEEALGFSDAEQPAPTGVGANPSTAAFLGPSHDVLVPGNGLNGHGVSLKMPGSGSGRAPAYSMPGCEMSERTAPSDTESGTDFTSPPRQAPPASRVEG